MSRLTDLANAIYRVLMRRDVFDNLIDIPMTERRMLVEADALLRAAAAETVGTEWPPLPHGVEKPHNADLHAARLAIADLKAERDEATKMAYMILPGDERNPGVTWREAYEILDEKALGEKHGHACAMSALAEQHNAALASLAEKQRAIDAAFATLDAGHGMLACREAAHTLRPHATKATEGQIRTAAHYTPSEIVANIEAIVDKVTEAKPPRQWTSTPPKNRSGKWWHAFKGRNYPPCLVLVADECGWDAALMESSVYALWLPWQEGDNANNLPPLPDRDTNRDAVSGSSTRELAEFKAAIKRASEIVAKWPDWKRGISGPGCSPHPLDEVTPTTTPTAAAATPAADACDTRELVEQLLDLVHRMLYETDQGNSRHLFRADLRNAANTLVAAARRGGGA